MRISELKKAIREMIVGELNEVEFQSKSGELSDVETRAKPGDTIKVVAEDEANRARYIGDSICFSLIWHPSP